MDGFENQDQWEDAIQQDQQNGQDEALRRADENHDRINGGYSKLDAVNRQNAMRQQDEGDCHLDNLLKSAINNGGKVPGYALANFNRAFNFDTNAGKGAFIAEINPETGVFEVGIGEGGFDNRGMPILKKHSADLRDQWTMMNHKNRVFSDDDRANFRKALSGIYSEDELDRAAGITKPVGSKTKTGRAVVPGSWLTGPQKRRGNISAFSSDGKGNFSNTDYNEATGRYERTESGQQENPLSEKERIEMMKEQGRNARAEARNQGRIDIANLQADLKALGYDIDLQKLAEQSAHNQQMEAQQAENEAGRNARAEAMLDYNWAKHDAVVKRWNNWYKIALKKAKTDEERAEIDRKYKEGRLEIANGNLDLKWSGLEEESAHNQQTEAQNRQRIELEKQKLELIKKSNALATIIDKAGVSGVERKEDQDILRIANAAIDKGDRESFKKGQEIIAELMDKYSKYIERQRAASGGGLQSSQAKGALKDEDMPVDEMRTFLKNRKR